MIEVLKKETNKSLKEIQENAIKWVKETNKTVEDLDVEIEEKQNKTKQQKQNKTKQKKDHSAIQNEDIGFVFFCLFVFFQENIWN